MKFEIIIFIVFFILGIGLGWAGNELYKSYTLDKKLDGLWLKNYNQSGAYEKSKELDNLGDWVCINILDMDYPRAYDTCIHECSHQAYSEIFAEQCEKDVTKCMEIIRK